jgi:Tfp pilus assembly protein PilO
MTAKLDNLSSRAKVALAGGLLALVLLGLWFVVVSPKRSQAADLKAEVAAAQAELTQRKADLARPSAAVTVRASDVFRLAKALPEDGNVAGVILDIDRLAAAHGLTLEGFQPTAVIPVTGYYAQPLTVTVQGRFGDVSRFLAELRQLVSVKKGRLSVRGRLYSVSEVRLGKPEGTAKYPVVRAGVLLNAFGLMPGVPATTTPATPEGGTTTPSSTGTTAAGATP